MQKILLIIGVEGSGHHLMHDCLSYEGQKGIRDADLEFQLKLYSCDFQENNLNKILQILKNRELNNKDFFLDNSSFPWGRPYRIVSRHDILNYYNLFEKLDYCDLHFIFLTRNIKHSTFSTHKRFDYKLRLVHTAKYQEDCLLFIISQLKILPQNKITTLDYYDVCKHPKKFETLLQNKFGHKIHFDQSKIKLTTRHTEADSNELLNKFFTEQRLSQFNYIRDNLINLQGYK
ncbi:hypothetical protein OAA62_00585 [bacterium]|nr:hypothetical protein [bacterium]